MLTSLKFAGDISAPTGVASPSARELQAMGLLGLELGRGGRVALISDKDRTNSGSLSPTIASS